jgi:hypothetical protein
MKTQKTTVGIYHRNQLNRKSLIKLLEKTYNCEEVERWEDVEKSTAQVLVLAAPELLYPEVSFEEMKRVINAQSANLIMINFGNRKWWVYRTKFIQLRNPSVEKLLTSIENLCPKKRVRTLFLGRELRA